MACADNNKKWKLSALTTANGFRKCTPPPCVAKLLDAEFLFGLKIQTHAWKTPQRKPKGGRDGLFGFYRACYIENLQYSRIVHVSWSAGSIDEAPVTKKFIIQPVGHCISDDAVKHHGISQEIAVAVGQPLREVLQIMMADVRVCAERGGRAVGHHMEPAAQSSLALFSQMRPFPPLLEARGWTLASFLRNCAAPGWIKMPKIGAVSCEAAYVL